MVKAPEADVRRAVEVLLQDPEECAALMFDTPGDAFDPVSKVLKPSNFPSCPSNLCIVDPPLNVAFAASKPLHSLNALQAERSHRTPEPPPFHPHPRLHFSQHLVALCLAMMVHMRWGEAAIFHGGSPASSDGTLLRSARQAMHWYTFRCTPQSDACRLTRQWHQWASWRFPLLRIPYCCFGWFVILPILRLAQCTIFIIECLDVTCTVEYKEDSFPLDNSGRWQEQDMHLQASDVVDEDGLCLLRCASHLIPQLHKELSGKALDGFCRYSGPWR